ncbi:protein kinase domain-containing protein [Streptomyces sp. NPDC055006]
MTLRDQLLGGRYQLVRQLGEGGMGQVWEAQDKTLGRPVAVKVISLLAGGGSRGNEARARFLREAQITAQLQHPNIVTIHDLGETGAGNEQVPFLVMELVRGEGLDAMLRRGTVTLPDAARWGAQIGDALADAHNARIMHRDIKPSNILITPSGTVKVLDFGIARAADPYATADQLTQTGFIVGTPPYMAPEQARGFPEPRSDLYALGCLLFELITGQLPFQAPDTVGYLSAHLTQEPPAPSSVSTDIPSAWDDLVLTLLDKDPAHRYLSAADLSQALRQLDHAPEPQQPPTTHSVRIDVESQRAWMGDEELQLTAKEFDLLRVLVRDAGQVVTHDQLMREVWDSTWWTSTKTLDMHISSLRKKLGDDAANPRYIATVRRVGFRFAAPGMTPPPPVTAMEPPPPHTTADDTRQQPEPAAPFAISWTGKDPLSTYAERWSKGWMEGLAKFVLVVTPPGIFVPLLLHRIESPGSGQDDAWMAWFVLSLVLGLFALGTLLWLSVMTHFHRTTKSWSLHVGQQGIATTDTTGTREYQWSHVQGATIEEIDSSTKYCDTRVSLYRYTGLHVQFTIDAAGSAPSRPAGWPPSFPGKVAARKSGLVPVCVLGPMADKQRSELTEALARYARQR